MSTADELSELLKENKGKYISGQFAAEKLSVSRTAIWKAVNTLRKAGYEIDAVTNRGYMLSGNGAPLTSSDFGSKIKHPLVRAKYIRQVTSTNDLVKKAALDGEKEGLVIISSNQTKGRGRMGRNFFSPLDKGIYFSILLRPNLSPEDSLLITTCLAVCVADSIEKNSGRETKIKWVNDINISSKKCCGILTEGAMDIESGRLSYAVAGIGINLFEPDGGFPDELKDKACAVYPYGKAKGSEAENIVSDIVDEFFDYYPDLTKKEFLKKYRDKSDVIGEDIFVIRDSSKRKAKATGIGDDFSLFVRYEDGTEEKLRSGEISIRKIG